VDEVSAGAAPAGGASSVRGGGAAGECGDLELPGLLTGVVRAGVSAAASAADRTTIEGVAAAAGEELVGVGPEASAGEGGAAIAGAVERGLCGSPREHFSLWRSGFGENARAMCGGPGVSAVGPAH